MAPHQSVDAGLGQLAGMNFSGQGTAQPADGIFDPAFLPGRLGIAEVSLHLQVGDYNSEFWKNYNVIYETALEKKQIQGLLKNAARNKK